MNLDQIFENIGEFGFYQKTRHVIYALLGIMQAWQIVAITFLGAYADYHCYNEELTNFTIKEQMKFMFRNEPSCDIFDLNYSDALYDFNNWNASDDFYDRLNKTKCETHWVYDKSVFSSTLNSKFKLCSGEMEYWAQSILNIGIFFGCLMVGSISDRYGRKKAIIGFQIIWIISALVGTVAPNVMIWLVSRFFVGLGSFACYDAGFVLAIETSAKKSRVLVAVLYQIYFSTGVVSLALIGYLVPDFTFLQLIMGVCPVVLVIMCIIVLDESPRWLVSQIRLNEALVIMKKISVMNKRSFSDKFDLLLKKTTCKKVPSIFDLFKTSNMRKTTIAMWTAWFSVTSGYYGLTFAVGNLSGNIFLNLALSGLVEIPACFVALLTYKRSSRCITVVSYTIVALLCFLVGILGVIGYREPISLIIMVMIAKFFCSIVFCMLYLTAAAVFPTTLRTVGVGSSSSMARLGGMIQPQVQKLQLQMPFIQYFVYGAITLLGSTGAFFIPETLDKDLPETVEDVENAVV